MKIILCHPGLTLQQEDDQDQAVIFYESCQREINDFVSDVQYLTTLYAVRHFIAGYEGDGVVFAFFNPSGGRVSENFEELLKTCSDPLSVIWPIAIRKENRMPPECVRDCQSFDVSAQLENRQLPEDSIRMIAFIFARKLISQALPELLCDKSLYFISHRRADGEMIAGKLADEINLLARVRRGYRDVVEVQVGKDAQEEIDEALKSSDVLILLQTPEAAQSDYIKKEVIYALLHDIPVLWIQIDGAERRGFDFIPLRSPHMKLSSYDFENSEKLERIADEVERQCFYLIMNNSGNVYNYVDLLKGLSNTYSFEIVNDKRYSLAYYLHYERGVPKIFTDRQVRQYIQCFGRNPKNEDRICLKERFPQIVEGGADSVVLLSRKSDNHNFGDKFHERDYEDYLINLETELRGKAMRHSKSIIISGAFPDCDKIYQASLSEALIAYAKEIVQQGYTLIFGAHPTFQGILLEIGKNYSFDPKDSIHMYMAEDFADSYDMEALKKNAAVWVTEKGEDLQESLVIMRRQMIQKSGASAMICLGGRIKADKNLQGVDAEICMAREAGIPVFLSGSVGGRSSELAAELNREHRWKEMNNAGQEFNEGLLYSLNHRKMARRILKFLEMELPSPGI